MILCFGFTPVHTGVSKVNDGVVVVQNNAGSLFDADGVKIGEAYPNPAESFIELKYAISNPDVRVKVVFHNLLGVRVSEHTLKAGDSSLTLSTEKFIPGVYFYTVNIDDQNVVTKKLIVKR
ncbi:MAG: T9SS type A sorting domain-containing protein [Cyclobacteriaceae bacterium]